ncbi:MAG: hypothetical protein R3A48_22680 [Polyangiales bacterium]
MVRALGGMISATLGVLVALVVAAATADRRQVEQGGVIDARDVRRAMTAEGEVARRAGMSLSAEGEGALALRGSRGAWSMPLRVGAGECVAVVVGISGRQRVQHVGLQLMSRAPDVVADDAMSLGSSGGGLVAHTQWCEREAVERRAVAVGEGVVSGSLRSAEHALRWAVYRGPWRAVGGPAGLTRGRLRPESLEALGADLALQQAEGLVNPSRLLGPMIPISMGYARLLPSDAVTYRALVQASTMNENAQVNPRVDTSLVTWARWNTGLPVNFATVRRESGADLSAANHDPVVDLGLNDFRRVLAVIDRGRLGVACAEVALVRHRLGYRAVVEALDADGSRHPLDADQNVAFDARCPASGPTVYLAPVSDHDPWTVGLLRTSAPDAP